MTTILITGASRGLGLEFTRQYLTEGWTVIAACRNPGTARGLQELEAKSTGALTVVEIDVTDGESVQRAASRLQGRAIDVLVNGAGIYGGHGQKLGSLDYESSRSTSSVRRACARPSSIACSAATGDSS